MDKEWHLNYNGTNDKETKSWYALYTAHQHEKVVEHILSEKGFEVFLPLYMTMRQWSDRPKKLTLPLFPCYVFVQGGLERRLEIGLGILRAGGQKEQRGKTDFLHRYRFKRTGS